MSTNLETIGFVWENEAVKKQHGDHATDRMVIGTEHSAWIPVAKDLDKIREHFGDGMILAILDGTSIRVMAQDVNRRMLAKGAKPDSIKDAIYNRLAGTRNTSSHSPKVVEVKVYNLPDGTAWSGTDVTEYRQMYVAALVANSVPTAVAITIAENQNL